MEGREGGKGDDDGLARRKDWRRTGPVGKREADEEVVREEEVEEERVLVLVSCSTMMRCGAPRPRRNADSWALRAEWDREVRASSWGREREEVMRGVRARSVRWRERCGCWEGRFAMVGCASVFVFWSWPCL